MIYSLDTAQHRLRNSTLKFIEEFHNCPAVWDVSFLAYKETKNKQKKTEELWDKLAFDETSLFPSRFLFLFFSSSYFPSFFFFTPALSFSLTPTSSSSSSSSSLSFLFSLAHFCFFVIFNLYVLAVRTDCIFCQFFFRPVWFLLGFQHNWITGRTAL